MTVGTYGERDGKALMSTALIIDERYMWLSVITLIRREGWWKSWQATCIVLLWLCMVELNQQGVSVIDFSPANNMLVTGSRDCTIRGWNPYASEHPVMVLRGHEAPVMFLRINEIKVNPKNYWDEISIKNSSLFSLFFYGSIVFVWQCLNAVITTPWP